MTTIDGLREIHTRLSTSFDSIKKATKPFAAAQPNDATMKGLRKGIAMYIDTYNTVLRDLNGAIDHFPDVAHLRSENTALGGKIQSLAFSVQEAEAALAKARAELGEEIKSLRTEKEMLMTRQRTLEQENERVKSLEHSLILERTEKEALVHAVKSISEDHASHRMEWQQRLAEALAVKWEDRHMISSQRMRDESLRTHVADLMEENSVLRSNVSRSNVSRVVSVGLGERDLGMSQMPPPNEDTLSLLREALATSQSDYNILLSENRSLIQKNEELVTMNLQLSLRQGKAVESCENCTSRIVASVTKDVPPKRTCKGIRHSGSQTSGPDFNDLLSQIDFYDRRVIHLEGELRFLEGENARLSTLLASSDDRALLDEISTLKVELKKKSFRVSKLLSELSGLQSNSRPGLEHAFEESQKGRAAAELELLALRRHLVHLQSKSHGISGKIFEPNVENSDPFVLLHDRSQALDDSVVDANRTFLQAELRLRSEIEHAEASVIYWSGQPIDESSQRMLLDANRRLSVANEEMQALAEKRHAKCATLDRERNAIVSAERRCLTSLP